MGAFSFWHWSFIIWLLIFIVPAWRIVSKAGFHGAWSLLLLVPVVNLILIWVFAFAKWPVDRHSA